ncbi:MAG: hypothetical protein M0007_05105, partial [Actinomycetota bacterium]|nr:hypothetical protein [Actinomycetota bacterium]
MGEQTSEDVPATASGTVSGRASVGGGSWREMLAAFSVPAFRWYWGSQFLSGIGTWSQAVAQ